MKIDGVPYRSIWVTEDGKTVRIIDQTKLPHLFATQDLCTLEDAAHAIKAMLVRGAPLIGATAAYGMALAIAEDASEARIAEAYDGLYATRPTAVNLRWALDDMRETLLATTPEERLALAYRRAGEICDDDVAINDAIGEQGLIVLRELWRRKNETGTLNLLTHCNAGWLATVDWGTALAPMYKAHDVGIPIHVWVDETRPRNQGASLTAWELGRHGVPHTVIADNVGGHLMQHGLVDLCITGTDRTTASGDVCNKIGTYLKALAAHDNGVPFYVALPGPTIDWTIGDGLKDIPIEQRDPSELSVVTGRQSNGELASVSILPEGSTAANYAFDVTPARLITGLITERGVAEASREGLATLYPDLAASSVA